MAADGWNDPEHTVPLPPPPPQWTPPPVASDRPAPNRANEPAESFTPDSFRTPDPPYPPHPTYMPHPTYAAPADADAPTTRPDAGARSALERQHARLARARLAAEAGGRRTSAATRATRARIRRATGAEGAGESGLAKLLELHAVNSAGDALIAVSLAGTLFFSVPTGEARGKVALYLLVTMAPFVLLAPVIGPVLDRFRHGRRGATAGSFALRGFLAWVLADAVAGGGIELYPAAFGVLVASKVYVVTRSSALPRVLPAGVSLVKANARVSLAGVAGLAIGSPIGIALAWIGPEWSLRLAFLVFIAGTIMAAMLPKVVDSAAGEVEARVLASDQPAARPKRGSVGPAVVLGLRVNAALRALSGFLTIFLLFLVRDQPVGGLSSQLSVALVGVSAIAGSTVGSLVGSRVRAHAPELIIVCVLAMAVVAALGAVLFYGAVAIAVMAATTGFGQQLGKLSLDAQIQRDVPERVRSSAFTRTETAIQLAWVLGGGLGIVLPLNPLLGMSIVAVGLLVVLAAVSRGFLVLRRSVAST